MSSRNKRKKLGRGIYLRGHIYWFAVQRNGQRHFITLETTDPAEAVRRAETMRDHVDIESGAPIKAEIDRFIAYKLRQQEYTRSSALTETQQTSVVCQRAASRRHGQHCYNDAGSTFL